MSEARLCSAGLSVTREAVRPIDTCIYVSDGSICKAGLSMACEAVRRLTPWIS